LVGKQSQILGRGFCHGPRYGISGAAAAILVILVIAVAGVAAVYFLGFDLGGRQVRYIADVQSSSLGQQTNYDLVNLVKDSAIVATASFAIVGCSAETLGACLASVPIVGNFVGPALNDDIVDTTANFQLSNVGNGTATGIQYDMMVYSDGKLIQSQPTVLLASLAPGASTNVSYTYSLKFGDIPTVIWNAIQSKGQIIIYLENLSYQGGT
jgi:hypothetical protein